MGKFYDGTKLLSLKDIKGEKPAIYMAVSNNSAGKTTWFLSLLVNRFIKKGEKFIILYRFRNELHNVSDKIFGDLKKFPRFSAYEMTEEKGAGGVYIELLLNDKSCGYAIALNCADSVKKMSHKFNDSTSIFMDEFISETGHYCTDEIQKFIIIYKAAARGYGEQVRPVSVYMAANPYTMLNPYYTAFGIGARLQADTKFLRGDGWVFEQNYNASAGQALGATGVFRAFSDSAPEYLAYSTEGKYLDNSSFVERPDGRPSYICTLSYGGRDYGIYSYRDTGILYCSTRADKTCKRRFAVTLDDMRPNTASIAANRAIIEYMRDYFVCGAFRFQNLLAKQAIFFTVGNCPGRAR